MLKKINDIKVKAVKIPIKPVKDFKGSSLFAEQFPNVFLLAKKQQGKTSCLYKIIKESVGKKTIVIIFSSTVGHDANMVALCAMLEKKDVGCIQYSSIHGDDGENLVEELVGYLKEADSEDKYNYIIVFDDLGNEIGNKYITQLLKTNRHFKCKVFISSQYYNDLAPAARQQIQYLLIFGGLPIAKMESVHKDFDISLDLDRFLDIYRIATEQKYQFLYIDVKNGVYRKNFNEEFII